VAPLNTWTLYEEKGGAQIAKVSFDKAMEVTGARDNVAKALLNLKGPVKMGDEMKVVEAAAGPAECYASLVQLAADLELHLEGDPPGKGE
jgi:hypothetical protein